MKIIHNLMLIANLAMFSLAVWADDLSPPYNEMTNDVAFTNAAGREFSDGPPSPVSVEIANSPTTATNFYGTSDDNLWFPPDTMGAVGPNHVVMMVNGQVVIKDRGGSLI